MISPLLLVLCLTLQVPIPSSGTPPAPKQSQAPSKSTTIPSTTTTTPSTTTTAPPAPQPQQSPNPQNQSPTTSWRDWFTGDRANWAIVLLTVVLSVIGYYQWRATRDANLHTIVIERAYVSMSEQEPWASFHQAAMGGGGWVTLRIKNTGHTPARITDVVLRAFVLNWKEQHHLPTIPDYVGSKLSTPQWPKTGFLVAGDQLDITPFLHIESDSSMGFKLGRGAGSTHMMYLIGYCDYIDAFGERYRTGWGRQYEPDTPLTQKVGLGLFPDRNNLSPVGQQGYNYSRKRKKGEGRDWNEPEQL